MEKQIRIEKKTLDWKKKSGSLKKNQIKLSTKNSDTETVLELYSLLNYKMLNKLNGMFAISILLTGETGNKVINFQDYNAQTIGIILLWLSAFLTLYTGYEYLRKGIDHAISEDSKN